MVAMGACDIATLKRDLLYGELWDQRYAQALIQYSDPSYSHHSNIPTASSCIIWRIFHPIAYFFQNVAPLPNRDFLCYPASRCFALY
jgi:hypothetical protein